jgi:tetratricopeptide (TPR) repeat protein
MKDNGTLLFCTSYFRDASAWQGRYSRWVDHHQAFPGLYDAMVMIDDGSPYEAGQTKLTTLAAADIGKQALPRRSLVRFPNNLGRFGTTVYPGWCRSFLFSLDIAEAYGFLKIVHVESDTYLLSTRIAEYIDRTNSGWTAFWSAKYRFPETALQIICADAYPAFGGVRDSGPGVFRGRPAEFVLPFTHVEKSLVGDRYSEFQSAIPTVADYAVQVTPDMEVRAPHTVRHRLRRLLSPAPPGPIPPMHGPRVPDAENVAQMPDAEARQWAYKSGWVAYNQGYFDAAKRSLERAASLYPRDARAKALLASCLLMLGDRPAALSEATAALGVEPNDAQAQGLVGEIYAQMEMFESAVEHFMKALELEPSERASLSRIRALEKAFHRGSASGDKAEAAMRERLMQRLGTGLLDERGYRTLLLVRKRTREGLRDLV